MDPKTTRALYALVPVSKNMTIIHTQDMIHWKHLPPEFRGEWFVARNQAVWIYVPGFA